MNDGTTQRLRPLPAVLVIEKNEELREAFCELLVVERFAVKAVPDIDEARTAIDEATPSAIIMSCDGADSAREGVGFAREMKGKSTFVMTSTDAKNGKLAEEAGVPFLLEPFEAEKLLAMIASVRAPRR